MREQIVDQKPISRRRVMVLSFFGGIAWGVGSVLGATIVVSILLALLNTVNVVPIIGDFVTQIIRTVDQQRYGSRVN